MTAGWDPLWPVGVCIGLGLIAVVLMLGGRWVKR